MARVCHAFGYLPAEVLGMAYGHFLVLVRNLDRCERERAVYTAMAFNDPGSLTPPGREPEEPEQPVDYAANRRRLAELLGAGGCEGR